MHSDVLLGDILVGQLEVGDGRVEVLTALLLEHFLHETVYLPLELFVPVLELLILQGVDILFLLVFLGQLPLQLGNLGLLHLLHSLSFRMYNH